MFTYCPFILVLLLLSAIQGQSTQPTAIQRQSSRTKRLSRPKPRIPTTTRPRKKPARCEGCPDNLEDPIFFQLE
ncbi:hypothetical protein DSO57_1020117 [Entomophthora muscae]|uniref:Uncharacterized protein n=1 Tax=Entomophthora muscae TaxID=34485 RepID=A0ACC2SSR4_9FUNG|nr:hypothetical protein DSO57_1020117 [Entomophthora muscae]